MVDKIPKKVNRDSSFITTCRVGILEDQTHRKIVLWAADCTEHVLHLFHNKYPDDKRSQYVIEETRARARREITMTQAREAAYAAHNVARDIKGS